MNPSPINPNAPTEVLANEAERTLQTVKIDVDGEIRDNSVDVILLLDQGAALRDHLSDQLKTALLEKRVKYCRGQTAEAELRLQALPRVLVTRRVLRALAAKAKEDGVELLDVLLKMEGAITIGKEALGDFFSKNEIDKMSIDGNPKAPSMPIKATGTGGASNPLQALRALAKLTQTKPELFQLPERKKPRESKDAPRIHYIS
jgi:hypothetical protein